MKIGSTLLIGAGGIGSHLAEPLARLLRAHDEALPWMIVVDGDVYEEGNASRQMFNLDEVGMSKCEALANRVRDALPEPTADDPGKNHIGDAHGYVSSDADAAGMMARCFSRGRLPEDHALLVVLAVDNDATRRLFYDGIAMLPMDHPLVVILDCGNDLETSTVVCSFWQERKSRLVSPVEMYENLRVPKDRVPGGGCQALAPSTPQLMVANMAAALSALLVVQALLDGKRFTDVVCANIRTFSMGVAGGEYGG